MLICRRIRKERAHNLNYYFYILNIFILTNLDLSESKAFRALVNSFKQISTQFVIGFVNGQVELIEATNIKLKIKNLKKNTIDIEIILPCVS